MNLTPLSSILKVAGAGFAGYGADKADAVKEAITQRAQDREDALAALKAQLDQKTLRRIDPGDPGYGNYQADVLRAMTPAEAAKAGAVAEATVAPHVAEAVQTAAGVSPIHTQEAINTAAGVSPIHTAEAVNTAKGTAPIHEQEHAANRTFDVENPEPSILNTDKGTFRVPSQGPAVPIVDAEGNTLTKGGPGGGAAAGPMAARAGQAGLALRAAGDLFPLHDKLAKVGVPFGAQTAAQTASGEGMMGKLPFAAEVANKALNADGNADYAQYSSILPNLLLGAAHAISGARINREQVDLLASGLKIKNSDTPAVTQQKISNLVDFLNSMRASVPEDVMAKEEAGIAPATMALLKQHGYGGAPTGYAYGQIKQVVPDFVPPSATPSAAPSSAPAGSGKHPSYEDWKKANGIP